MHGFWRIRASSRLPSTHEVNGVYAVAVGYPVFMSFAIIVGNFHGFRTGEWRGAGSKSVRWILVGIAILIAGVCVLGLAHWIGPPPAAPISPAL